MKKYLYCGLILVIVLLLLSGFITFKSYKKYKELYNRQTANVEAYAQEYSTVENQNKQFRMTIDELRASNDSINRKLVSTIEQLKIKDKNVQYLQYQTQKIIKTDTITVKDTIFRDTVFVLDTTLCDDWYSLDLSLQYPSTIITTPSFRSEKYVVISTKKEYNKQPSKVFFIRWFQRKHKVTCVDIEEKSPYIINTNSRFIKVE